MTNFSNISQRISRILYLKLKVSTLQLPPPINFLEDISLELIQNHVLPNNLRFSANLLMFANKRYLLENYSLKEYKKCLHFALADYSTNIVSNISL